MPLDLAPADFWGTASSDAGQSDPIQPTTPVSISSIADVLKTVTGTIFDTAKAVTDLQIAQDNLAGNQQQRALNMLKTRSDIQIAQASIAGNLEIAKANINRSVAAAQAGPSQAGENWLMILAIVGVGVAVLQLEQK